MAPTIGTLYFLEDYKYKADKALIAAKLNGLTMSTSKFEEKDSKKPEFRLKNPMGKVPFLETERGCISHSNAVARYVARCRADTSLYGDSLVDEMEIDEWLDFSIHEVEVPLMTWIYPIKGLVGKPESATVKTAQEDVKKALKVLEDKLSNSQFLLKDVVTLADVVLVCSLKEGFLHVFDPNFRKPFPKLCKWFQTCCELPHFKAVLGAVKLCDSQAKVPEKAPEPKAKAEVKAAPKAAAASAADVEACGNQIRELKAKLKEQGLSGKQINVHPEVTTLVEELQALKAAEPKAEAKAAPKAEAKAAPKAEGASAADVEACGNQIRELKAKLKEQGLSGKQINGHPEVTALVEQLQKLKAASG